MKIIDSSAARLAQVLLVEDNDIDVELTRRAFEKAKLAIDLHRVENGRECMGFLRKEEEFADVPRPDVILLDLNMPLMNGREVLAEMSRDEDLGGIPVVVLTTSDDERDVLESYRLRCSSYITKPVEFQQFQDVIESFGNYWFSVVVLPPK